MEKERHVCALKYAKELKELGYPQDDSLFYWVKWIEATDTGKSGEDRFEDYGFHWSIETRVSAERGGAKLEEFEYYAAPTVAELGEALPISCASYRKKKRANHLNFTCIISYKRLKTEADTEADARVKMYILVKNKLIKVEEMKPRGQRQKKEE